MTDTAHFVDLDALESRMSARLIALQARVAKAERTIEQLTEQLSREGVRVVDLQLRVNSHDRMANRAAGIPEMPGA